MIAFDQGRASGPVFSGDDGLGLRTGHQLAHPICQELQFRTPGFRFTAPGSFYVAVD
jgi:hypothetical protein